MIRPIVPDSESEIALVAIRMRATLMEVLGTDRGEAMYTLEWLRERVGYHLNPAHCDGEVLLSVGDTGDIHGHIILRVETSEDGLRYGLFSTIYVEPDARRDGRALELVKAGEAWFRARKLPYASTNTDPMNLPLIRLYESVGYQVTSRSEDFVVLQKALVDH